jgi:hypothetical protein
MVVGMQWDFSQKKGCGEIFFEPTMRVGLGDALKAWSTWPSGVAGGPEGNMLCPSVGLFDEYNAGSIGLEGAAQIRFFP